MKNLLLLTLLFVATSAMASDKIMPTIYGKVNKEVGYVTQKKEMGYDKFTGAKDTLNSSTRLGAKNTHELDSMKASYKVELGIGSSVTVREAKLDLSDFWGTATVGQTYAATGMVGLELDPFSHTGVGWTGVDQSKLVRQAVANSIGYYYRGRPEVLGYTTPDLMGLQLSVSYDQDGRVTNLSGPTYDSDGDAIVETARKRESVEGLLSFKKEMDNMGVKLYAGISQFVGKESIPTTGNYTKDDKSMLFGGQFSFNPVTVSVLYQDRKLENHNTATPPVTVKPKYNWLSGSIKVNLFEKDFVALTYASQTYDNGVSGALKNKYSQIAAGYQHQCGDYLTLRLTAANYTVKDKAITGVLPATTKNSATLVLAGAQLAF